MHILRCMGSKFRVKFQRPPLKFHTKFWTHTPQNVHFTVFIFCVWVTISLNCDVISLSETGPWSPYFVPATNAFPGRITCPLSGSGAFTFRDDVTIWKRFPRYWPFGRRIHQPPVDSPREQWCGILMFYLVSFWTNSKTNSWKTPKMRCPNVHLTSLSCLCCKA